MKLYHVYVSSSSGINIMTSAQGKCSKCGITVSNASELCMFCTYNLKKCYECNATYHVERFDRHIVLCPYCEKNVHLKEIWAHDCYRDQTLKNIIIVCNSCSEKIRYEMYSLHVCANNKLEEIKDAPLLTSISEDKFVNVMDIVNNVVDSDDRCEYNTCICTECAKEMWFKEISEHPCYHKISKFEVEILCLSCDGIYAYSKFQFHRRNTLKFQDFKIERVVKPTVKPAVKPAVIATARPIISSPALDTKTSQLHEESTAKVIVATRNKLLVGRHCNNTGCCCAFCYDKLELEDVLDHQCFDTQEFSKIYLYCDICEQTFSYTAYKKHIVSDDSSDDDCDENGKINYGSPSAFNASSYSDSYSKDVVGDDHTMFSCVYCGDDVDSILASTHSCFRGHGMTLKCKKCKSTCMGYAHRTHRCLVRNDITQLQYQCETCGLSMELKPHICIVDGGRVIKCTNCNAIIDTYHITWHYCTKPYEREKESYTPYTYTAPNTAEKFDEDIEKALLASMEDTSNITAPLPEEKILTAHEREQLNLQLYHEDMAYLRLGPRPGDVIDPINHYIGKNKIRGVVEIEIE